MKKLSVRRAGWVPAGVVAALLAACSSTPLPPPEPPPVVVAPPAAEPPPVVEEPKPSRVSAASSPRAYRRDAAGHLYELHRDRIWKGRMPPLLYAIGVLQVEVDRQGQVREV